MSIFSLFRGGVLFRNTFNFAEISGPAGEQYMGIAITGVLITVASLVLPFFDIYVLLPFSGILYARCLYIRLRNTQLSAVFTANGPRQSTAFSAHL